MRPDPSYDEDMRPRVDTPGRSTILTRRSDDRCRRYSIEASRVAVPLL